MTITIQYATAADAQAITDLVQAEAAATGWDSPLVPAYVSGYLASPISRILLARENGSVVGLLSYSTRPDLFHAGECCLIEELVVAEDRRSQGIGGLLLDHVMECARQNGWAEIALGVMPDNVRAQEFYHRHGLLDCALLLERHFLE